VVSRTYKPVLTPDKTSGSLLKTLAPSVPKMGKFTDFFSSNFVFDVDQDCQAYGIDIFEACQIHFSPDNGTVLRYGDVEPGYFKGNPDIAGLGVCALPSPNIPGAAYVF